ncbi:MAG: D-alanine--D-alanine ligase [Planctomycetes bacterium GWF2_41_51]|nr:MAG: D-alanine--D-alanine ligase [Planctomycetes bacterium GWF2_41_51]HBG26400.1 D-alanine--D-alanine ligase [Phycisphaerales bacterium]
MTDKRLIGFVYDLRKDYLAEGYSEQDVAEFDSEDTINSICKTIESLGYKVERIGNGKSLCKMLTAGKRWDMVFNIAEGLGGRCRESYVPAILEMYQIPYTFSDPLVCATTLDKAISKQLVAWAGLATAKFAVVENEKDLKKVKLSYPLFAKPLAEGTGKGIDGNSHIENAKQLKKICVQLLSDYRQPVLVEEYLPGREFTTAILGTGADAKVLGTMEIEMRSKDGPAIYSYVNKEECESRIFYHPVSNSPALKKKVEKLALECYKILQCRDAGRVDIRCDQQGKPCFLEVNPLPGLHPSHSDLPMIATQEGMSYKKLIGTILDNAFKRANNG